MALFPEKIWDGTTTSRPDLTTVQPPTYSDWLTLLAELRATQSYVLNLTENIGVMPNIGQSIKCAEAKIDKLLVFIKHLSPPADLCAEVEQMRQRLSEVDVRVEHNRLKNGVKRLFLRTKALESAHRELAKVVNQSLAVLTNSTRNQVATFVREMTAKQSVLQEQIMELQDVLERPDLD